MKRFFLAFLLVIALGTFASAQDVNFQIEWDPVTKNADDTPITDLSHYKFYLCDTAIQNDGTCTGNLKTFTVPKDQLFTDIEYTAPSQEGTIFVRGSAVDESDNESILSNQIAFEFSDDVPPDTIILRIKIPQ